MLVAFRNRISPRRAPTGPHCLHHSRRAFCYMALPPAVPPHTQSVAFAARITEAALGRIRLIKGHLRRSLTLRVRALSHQFGEVRVDGRVDVHGIGRCATGCCPRRVDAVRMLGMCNRPIEESLEVRPCKVARVAGFRLRLEARVGGVQRLRAGAWRACVRVSMDGTCVCM